MDAPTYKQSPLDPAFMSLMAKNQQQDIEATQTSVQRETASLNARYGPLTAGDPSDLLARYGAQLALANAGGAPPDLNKLFGKVA